MVYLEAAPHGRRSNDCSLYDIANSIETRMQCQGASASRVISPYVRSASDTKTLMIYINLLSFNMVFDAVAREFGAAVYRAQDLPAYKGTFR